jgi:hypothetical protein
MRPGRAYHGWYTARDARSSHVPPTTAPTTSAVPASVHTTSRIQRHTPSRRTLAPIVLNHASTPHVSAATATNHDSTGPHDTAIVRPMSKNVEFIDVSRTRTSIASIAATVSTTFSPVVSSVASASRSGVSRAVWYA